MQRVGILIFTIVFVWSGVSACGEYKEITTSSSTAKNSADQSDQNADQNSSQETNGTPNQSLAFYDPVKGYHHGCDGVVNSRQCNVAEDKCSEFDPNTSCQKVGASKRSPCGCYCSSVDGVPRILTSEGCKKCVGGKFIKSRNLCECPSEQFYDVSKESCVTCPNGGVFDKYKGECKCALGQEKGEDGQCRCKDPEKELRDGVCRCKFPGQISVNGVCQCVGGQILGPTGCECPARSQWNKDTRQCECENGGFPKDGICQCREDQRPYGSDCVCKLDFQYDYGAYGGCLCSFGRKLVFSGGEASCQCVNNSVPGEGEDEKYCSCPPGHIKINYPTIPTSPTSCKKCPPGTVVKERFEPHDGGVIKRQYCAPPDPTPTPTPPPPPEPTATPTPPPPPCGDNETACGTECCSELQVCSENNGQNSCQNFCGDETWLCGDPSSDKKTCCPNAGYSFPGDCDYEEGICRRQGPPNEPPQPPPATSTATPEPEPTSTPIVAPPTPTPNGTGGGGPGAPSCNQEDGNCPPGG